MEVVSTVYQYFGADGNLLYVGVTDRGVRRAHEHADSKPWWHLATGCTLEHCSTRAEALEREAALIKRFRPPYNQQHNPERSLPLEQRTGLNNRKIPAAKIRPPGTRARMRAWYEATPEQRLSMSCADCQSRPTDGCGPCCVACFTARKLRALAAL